MRSAEHTYEHEFFDIRILKRTLNGSPIIEILINEADQKVMNCFLTMEKNERVAQENYEESFKATNCHELRTPINTQQQQTVLMIEALQNSPWKDSPLIKQTIEKLELMLSQLNMMEGFAEDMLNFAMIKAQKFSLNFANFSLFEVVRYLRETFRLKAEAKGVNLSFVLTKKLPLPNSEDAQLL